MNQFKKCKVVILPTNEKVNALKGYLDKSLLFNYQKEYKTIEAENGFTGYFHLYILLDDKIEVSDWYYNGEQILQYGNHFPSSMSLPNNCKKVIATTDKSLFNEQECPIRGSGSKVKYILPEPSQGFIQKYIEAYNKGDIITNVLVEYELYKLSNSGNTADIIENGHHGNLYRLKINPKDNTITIKKVKDSWDREELIALFIKFTEDRGDYFTKEYLPKWIQENL